MINIGTDQDLVLSNNNIDNVDSVAKLSILSKSDDDAPQILLTETNYVDEVEQTWPGNGVKLKYSKNLFEIGNVKQSDNELNLELMGSNNIYHTSIKGVYNNTLIYSEGNKLDENTKNCDFIHSDYNLFNTSGASYLNFINSNYNNVNSIYTNGEYASARNISFYNSDSNTIRPIPAVENSKAIEGCYLDNQVLIGSNYNYIKGRTVTEDNENISNTIYINSNSGLYNFSKDHGSLTMIGNNLGYYSKNENCNVIGIGEGLLQVNGNSDKIILGFFNKNSTDPNEVLIVGDGRCNRDYVDNLVKDTPDWTSNLIKMTSVIGKLSGEGSTAKNSSGYRHNIFTVNKKGYITISDYSKPTNSARYGYDGITAFVDNETYEIPFSQLYDKLNSFDTVDRYYETISSKITEINDKLEAIPTTKYLKFDDTSITGDVQLSAYLNMDVPATASTANSITLKTKVNGCDNNTIVGITYQPTGNNPAKLIWEYYLPVEEGQERTTAITSIDIVSYETIQFLLLKPGLGSSSMSGLTPIKG